MRGIPRAVLGLLEVQVNLPAFGNSDVEPIAPPGPVAVEKRTCLIACGIRLVVKTRDWPRVWVDRQLAKRTK